MKQPNCTPMPISDRDEDGRHIDDRWRTPMGGNPFFLDGFPEDYDWTAFDAYFGITHLTSEPPVRQEGEKSQ